MLLQYNKNSKLYPVAFLFWKLAPAKLNYKIYNKELLIIIRYFKQWHLKLKEITISDICVNRPQEPIVLYNYKAINIAPNSLG